MPKKGQSIRKGVQNEVFGYLKQNPNVHVTVSELQKEFGEERGRVQSALRVLAEKPDLNVFKLDSEVYMYRPIVGSRDSRGPLFIQVGATQTGRVILEREDGVLGIWTPIE